jgi:hypothetical protein
MPRKGGNGIEVMEKYLAAYPKADYYDVIGIIPQRATIRSFVGPDDPYANKLAVERLARHPPQLLFYVQKFNFLQPFVTKFLESRYFSIGHGVFAQWHRPLGPLRLSDRKSLPVLRREVEAIAAWVGRPSLERFSALVGTDDKHVKRLELKPEELYAMVGRKGRLKVYALSPFLGIKEPIRSMVYLFGFDGNY